MCDFTCRQSFIMDSLNFQTSLEHSSSSDCTALGFFFVVQNVFEKFSDASDFYTVKKKTHFH